MPSSTRNRRSNLRAKCFCWLLVFSAVATARQDLPVFLADNHAETFSWIARTFDPDDTYTLVLVDAHSDASAAERSEEIREQLRRVPNLEERCKRATAWRKSGRIQAFNWIEPLMPRPLERVFWLAAPELSEKTSKTEEAVSSLDGRLEFEPRSSGSFADRWTTGDLDDFESFEPGKHKVILAIDLDFFAGMKPEVRESSFSRIWKRAMDWPGLTGIAFAVSRPWLTDDTEATDLVSLAVDTVSRTRGAILEIDAEPDTTPDDSLNALAAEREGRKPPRWNFTDTPLSVKTQLALLENRLSFTGAVPEFPSTGARIIPTGGEIDCDEVWRFRSGAEPVLRLEAPSNATGRVRWHTLVPVKPAYDLIPETGLGKSFTSSAGRRIYEERRSLGETSDLQLAPAAWKSGNAGRVRITAEYETPEGWMPVPEIELRISNRDGFLGSLSECFGMPYVFGVGGITTGDLTGVETGWGSDCANFLIHAWRSNGHSLTWGDPARLRSQLQLKARDLTPDDRPSISQEEIENGLTVDFGPHVAAVWEDREPIGTLDGADLVVHHLGDFPEIVTLKQLTTSRPRFSLFTPVKKQLRRIRFAGDVVLAGDAPKIIPDFERGESDLFIANLEGIPTSLPVAGKLKYDFRFPSDRLDTLRKAGIGLVSLANNHAMDAGSEGLLDGMVKLEQAGIPFIGAGANETAACRPWQDSDLAVFGICIVGGGAAGPDTPGIAMLPDHAELLENEFKRARASGKTVVVILHGGDEYQPQVNDDQRHWARWLSARGVSVIAGAHPHVTQRTEIHAGTTILYSLGNAVYPAALSGLASGEIRTLGVPVR